tara:strand:+ start:1544 stop:2338 length:795 start_codon:yes stop_codon:yes gene_type:complete
MPAMLFFGTDWLTDNGVRSVGLAARGLWMDMLCIMYESPKRGYLSVVLDKPMTHAQLARMVGADKSEVIGLLEELDQANVYSVGDNSVIYSRRMVSDETKRAVKSRAGSAGATVRWKGVPESNDSVDIKTELDDNSKAIAPLVIGVPDSNSYNSNKDYIEKRKARQIEQPIEIVLVIKAIPNNKLNNPRKTIEAAMDALDRLDGDRTVNARLIAGRIAMYYESDEGRSLYCKRPHNFLDDDCHMADPKSWERKQEGSTGWDSVE